MHVFIKTATFTKHYLSLSLFQNDLSPEDTWPNIEKMHICKESDGKKKF